MNYLEKMTSAYLECAIWTHLDEDGNSIDHVYDIEDFEPASYDLAEHECADFIELSEFVLQDTDQTVQDELCPFDLGRNFWLSRNGHGTGFFDGPYNADTRYKLQLAAKSCGESFILETDNEELEIM